MTMPMDNPTAVLCAKGHSRRFNQFQDGSMRRLHQEEPADFTESSPWMPDETGIARKNGVYCAFCDSEADFSNHPDAWLSLMNGETCDWSEVPYRVCDGLFLTQQFPKILSNIVSHLEKLNRDSFSGHIRFSLDCSWEACDEFDEEGLMKFNKDRAEDVITSLAFLVLQLATKLDEGTWSSFLEEQREGACETEIECELSEWLDPAPLVEIAKELFDQIEAGELDIDDLDFGD